MLLAGNNDFDRLYRASHEKEFQMRQKSIFFVVLACLLAFGLTAIGCSSGSGGGGGDLIKVDLSLPPIQEVASFAGKFVATEKEAQTLISDALDALDNLGGLPGDSKSINYSMSLKSSSMSRSAYNEPYEEIFDNQRIAQGAFVTGFVKGYEKGYAKDDNNPGGTVGDYEEISMKVKAAVTFTNATGSGYKGCTFNGKYTYDENMYLKAQVTSLNPDKGKVNLDFNAANGYALSVSKDGKGLKFVMKLQAKAKLKNQEVLADDFDIDTFDVFKLTIEVYNNNTATPTYSQTFNNFEDANKYLDLNIGLL